MVNNNLLSSFIVVILILSFPVWLQGQGLSQKSGNPGQKTGQQKQSKNIQSHTHNPSAKSGQNSDRFNKRQSVGNNSYENHSGSLNKNYDGKYSYKKHNKRRDYKHRGRYKKYYPYYFPYYYSYSGYSYYPDYYMYDDPDYPYGYGTTLGSTLERPSNLEVNRYGDQTEERGYDGQGDTAGDVPYARDVYGTYTEYYGPPPSEEQTIYIWVDENGIENYVNDLDLVPLEYRNDVRILGGE